MQANLLENIYPYRGRYTYTGYREFFTPDIVEDYSKARIAVARYYFDRARYKEARREFEAALALQPLFPQVYNLIAYSYVQENNYALAKATYILTIEQFEKMLGLAVAYNALDDMRASISKDIADTYISLGVCSEKTLNDDESLKYYSMALEAYPQTPRAYFNRSVIFWKRGDWQSVTAELEKALRLDPNFREAAYYLELAKKKIRS